MFNFKPSMNANAKSVIDALSKSVGIIEFDSTGRILTANPNFCDLVGYSLAEIEGKHHSMFVTADYIQSPEYRSFWDKLGNGEFNANEFRRVGKGGREIWIQASYNPIKSSGGKVVKVVKVATDITKEKLRNAEFEAKLNAISRVQAVIEFTPAGEVITANENFLSTLGYGLSEIKGKNHSLFVEPTYSHSAEYRDFWAKLNSGEYVAAEFKRIGKGGKEVWIQASYNPIFDTNKKVVKIVKFATDITERVHAIEQIALGLSALSENDLECKLVSPLGTAFEKLRTDYNGSVETLQSSMQRIAERTNAIQSGAREIATASDELSRRTEQQAANLEETAAALDHITVTVKKSAEGAAHAQAVVAKADDDAKNSAVVVRQATNAMDLIAKSAAQISQIIGVIDEIAFQTNLLALNAGVEAARAGDAGRGFAVVASEVRALAQRSAEAAKEIKGLISTSGSQVDHGVKLVAETGKSLERIMTQVNDINNVVTDIAAGAKEQATGLAEINTAIGQMDQATQQNAAMAEESTAASHTLSRDAADLTMLVSVFKVGTSGGAARPDQRKSQSDARRPVSSAPRKAPVTAHVAPRMVANGAPVASGNDDWQEF